MSKYALPENIAKKLSESIVSVASAGWLGSPLPIAPFPFFKSRNHTPDSFPKNYIIIYVLHIHTYIHTHTPILFFTVKYLDIT